MALQEKDPNVRISLEDVSRKIRFPKVAEKKKCALKAHHEDDDKENIPPVSSYGMKRPLAIYDDHQKNNVENCLTEKWIKDSSEPFSQTQLTLPLPPPIQRTSRSAPKKDEKYPIRSSSKGNSSHLILPPRINHEGRASAMGHIYEDEQLVINDLKSSFDSRMYIAGCSVEKGTQPGRNIPGMIIAPQNSDRDSTFELNVLGRTRQAAASFNGSCEEDGRNYGSSASTKDGKVGFEHQSLTAVSDCKNEKKNTMNFSAALRHNLNVSPTKQPPPRPPPATSQQDRSPEETNKSIRGSSCSIRTLKATGSAEQAEYLLRQMLCDYHEGITDSPPDGGCFNSVVHAYASRGEAPKAEAVLALMWHEFYRGSLPPDKRIFTTVMYAWQRSDQKLQAPEACEHLLRQMHQLSDTGVAPACGPDTFTYTCILHCWANSERHDAAQRAEALFRVMIQRFESGDNNLKPDTICYSNLINVFVNCGRKYHDAERILWEMVDNYLIGLDSAEPTVRSFNTLLAVWSKSSLLEAPERVQAILQRWKTLNSEGKIATSPDEYSYALLLKAWSKTNRLDAIHKLLESFDWIKNLYEAGEESACPDVIKYTTVIGALNKGGQVDRAFVLLGELINKYNEFKTDRYKPDARCFHIILTAFSRSRGNLSAGKKAESLLRRMWSLHKSSSTSDARPTNWTYNTVVFCYQNAGDPKRAERLLREMDSLAGVGNLDRGADIRTYKAVVAAWRFSSDQSKHNHIRSLQDEARRRFNQQI